uniref:Pyroglutamyl-peptidase I like n=1 Tax=Lynx canadensis TaxID=61383 RepID=A0A667GIC8_LYNCA
MDSQSSCVMATCFGPFRQHLVNSSWEAVKELSKLGPNSRREVGLRVLQRPVDYREVTQRVTRIWEDLQPQLVVHIELDASAKAIVLEQRAKNRGSWDADIRGFRPARGEGLPDGPEVIASGVSTRALSKLVAVEGAQVVYSRNAGRYVCDYTCYLSLHHGNGRTALARVPPLSCWLQDVLDQMRKPELKAR